MYIAALENLIDVLKKMSFMLELVSAFLQQKKEKEVEVSHGDKVSLHSV